MLNGLLATSSQPWRALGVTIFSALILRIAGEPSIVEDIARHLDSNISRRLSLIDKRPTDAVIDLVFKDTSNHTGLVQGNLEWKNPPDVSRYGADYGIFSVILNHPDELNGVTNLAPPGNPNDGPSMLFVGFPKYWYWQWSQAGCVCGTSGSKGVFEYKSTFGGGGAARRGTYSYQNAESRYQVGKTSYLDRYICNYIAYLGDPGSSSPFSYELGPLACTPIRDNTTERPRLACNPFNFADSNSQEGLLTGTFTFTVPNFGEHADFTTSSHYKMDLVHSLKGPEADPRSTPAVAKWPVGDKSNFYSYHFTNFPRGNANYIRLYNIKEDCTINCTSEMRSVIISDSTQYLPPVVPAGGSFTDTNPNAGEVEGTIVWTPPDNQATTDAYQVYFGTGPKTDNNVANLQFVGEVPVGTNYLNIKTTIDGVNKHILVYGKNANGKSASASGLQLVDNIGR